MLKIWLTLIALPVVLAQDSTEPPWVEMGQENGITVYRRKLPDDPVFAYKGEGLLQAPLGKIISVATDVPRRIEWVNRLAIARVVREISPTDKVIYMKVNAPWPVNDRDFVVESKYVVDPVKKTASFDMHSIEDAAVPIDKCCVRALVHSNHVDLRSVGENQTAVVAEAHVDPRGSLPPWLVNFVQKTFPRKTLDGLLKQVGKPDIADFFNKKPQS